MRICPQCGTETSALTCRHDGFGTVDAARYRKNDPTTLLGTLFQDRYRVDAVLGSGGMGSVYRATQVRVGRHVALKVINAELAYDLAVVARFQREGRAIASLIHPNIVQVYDFGQTDDGQLFMAMELVTGKTLAELIRDEAPVDPSRVVHIGAQMFDALAEAHDHGVIHRDLKPDNVFVTETGRRRDVVKILDFGVAKIVNEPKTESMVTARGAILGSPKYMAPEQARGKGVTGHADIYAVGGILYELLTGHAVFNEPSPADYLVAHSVKMPSAPSVGGRELRGPLVDLIMRCLEKKPWNRPDGAARALEMIEACRLTPVLEPGDNAPVRLRSVPADQDESPRRLVRSSPAPEPGFGGMESDRPEPPPLPVSAAAPLPGGVGAHDAPRGETSVVTALPSRAERPWEQAQEPPALEVAASAQPAAAVPETVPAIPAAAAAPTAPTGTAPVAPTRASAFEALPAMAPVDTRRATIPTGRAPAAPSSWARTSAAQDDPTIIAPATTAGGLAAVQREPQRTGAGLWLLAAALLLFAGGLVFLASNDFFRAGPGDPRTAQGVRAPIEDPVQPATLGPVAPGPSAESVVAAAPATGPAPGSLTGAEATTTGAAPGSQAGAEAPATEAAPGSVAGAAVAATLAPTSAGAAAAGPGDEGTAAGGSAADDEGEAVDLTPEPRVVVGETDTAPARTPTPAATAPRDGAAERAAARLAASARADERARAGATATEGGAAATREGRRSVLGVESPTPRPLPADSLRAPAPAAATPQPAEPGPAATTAALRTDEPGQIRRVIVHTDPPGAEVMMGALPLGEAPVAVEWKDFGQRVMVTVRKEGFEPLQMALSPTRRHMTATLKPVTMEDRSAP